MEEGLSRLKSLFLPEGDLLVVPTQVISSSQRSEFLGLKKIASLCHKTTCSAYYG